MADFNREVIVKFNAATGNLLNTIQSLTKNSGALGNAVAMVNERYQKLGDKSKVLSTMATISAGAFKWLFKITSQAGAFAESMEKISAQTGLSAQSLQAYHYATELVDVDVNAIAASAKKMQLTMNAAAKGTGSQADAFKYLNVNLKNTDGTLRSNGDVFNETILKLSKMKDISERNALASQLFGRSYGNLLPLLNDGGKSIKKIQDMGIILPDKQLEQVNKFKDYFDTFKLQLEGVKNVAGAKMAEAFNPFLAKLENITTSITKFIANKPASFFQNIARTVALATAAFGGMFAFTKVYKSFSEFTNSIKMVGLSLGVLRKQADGTTSSLTRMGVTKLGIIALIAGLALVLYKAYQSSVPLQQAVASLGATFAPIVPLISQLVVGLGQWLAQAIQSITPYLVAFASWLGTVLPPIVQAIAGWLTTTLIPAISATAQWIGANLIPAIVSIVQWFSANLLPAIMAVAQWIMSNLVPALASIFSWISKYIVPIVASLVAWFASHLAPAIASVAHFLIGTLGAAFSAVASIINTVITTVGKVITAIKNFFKYNPVGSAIVKAFQAIADAVNAIVHPLKTVSKWFDDIFGKQEKFSTLKGEGAFAPYHSAFINNTNATPSFQPQVINFNVTQTGQLDRSNINRMINRTKGVGYV